MEKPKALYSIPKEFRKKGLSIATYREDRDAKIYRIYTSNDYFAIHDLEDNIKIYAIREHLYYDLLEHWFQHCEKPLKFIRYKLFDFIDEQYRDKIIIQESKIRSTKTNGYNFTFNYLKGKTTYILKNNIVSRGLVNIESFLIRFNKYINKLVKFVDEYEEQFSQFNEFMYYGLITEYGKSTFIIYLSHLDHILKLAKLNFDKLSDEEFEQAKNLFNFANQNNVNLDISLNQLKIKKRENQICDCTLLGINFNLPNIYESWRTLKIDERDEIRFNNKSKILYNYLRSINKLEKFETIIEEELLRQM